MKKTILLLAAGLLCAVASAQAPVTFTTQQDHQNMLDQYGSWQAAVAAGAAYKLLGAKDLGVSNDYRNEPMPPVLTGLLDGELAWRQHDGGHTDGPNMKYFIEWASNKIRNK